MTEPLIVEPDRLDAASDNMGRAAARIPVELPKFSVTGSDPLSLAVAAGALHVEEPMAALPGIKAEAQSLAGNIAVAARRYRETDQLLAEKAERQQFASASGGPEGQGKNADQGTGKGNQFSWMPSTTERFLAGAGAVVEGTTEKVRDAAIKALKDSPASGPGKASSALTTFLDDVKVLGREVKGVSRVGGLASLVMAVPNVLADKAEGASTSRAVAKEGAGILAAAAAGAVYGSVVPGAGTAVGFVVGLGVGAAASMGASKLVDRYWEPAADAVGSAVRGVESAANSAMRAVGSVFAFGGGGGGW